MVAALISTGTYLNTTDKHQQKKNKNLYTSTNVWRRVLNKRALFH